MAIAEIINPLVGYSAAGFTLAGVLFVMYGGIYAILKLLHAGNFSERGKSRKISNEEIRKGFSRHVIFGLEFLIAADILKTVLTPTTDGLIKLAAIVLIRVSLGYILEKDVQK